MRYRTRMTGLVLGLATTGALLAAGLTGCGGGGKATSGATPGSTPSGGQQLQAYISCLNQHGVKITLPSGRPTGFPSRSGGFGGGRSGRPTSRPNVRPSGGRSGAPGGGFGGGGLGGFGDIFGNDGQPPAGVDQATWKAAQQACASVQPSFGVGGDRGARGGADNGAYTAYLNCLREHGAIPSSGPATAMNTADPAVAAALKTCEPLRPSGGPNPGSSPTG